MFHPQSPYGNWNCKHKKFCKYLKRDGQKDVIEPFYHAGKLSGYRIDVACGNQNLSQQLYDQIAGDKSQNIVNSHCNQDNPP